MIEYYIEIESFFLVWSLKLNKTKHEGMRRKLAEEGIKMYDNMQAMAYIKIKQIQNLTEYIHLKMRKTQQETRCSHG